MEYILYASAAALLEVGGATLLGIQRMLSDASYRYWVVKQVKDPIVHAFWVSEFERYDKYFIAEVVAPVQNKVGQLLMSPLVRNVLGQVRSKINARFMMDNKRILIANLAKGKLGEDKANLLGALWVSQFQLAALSRADVSEESRKDFHLYVDEFHNFTTDSFASILSEARKYRLCLTLSHQYVAQLRPEIRDAVFGNVGTLLAFRVGEHDATILSREFGGKFNAAAFTDVGNFHMYAKLLVNGETGEPFLGKTFPPLDSRSGRRDAVVRCSRERYATPRATVENKIRKWMRP